MASDVRKLRARIRDFALGLPEANEALPWGERVAKVNKKVFVFLGRDMDRHFGFAVKLPRSRQAALGLPFTEPTGYGLGKSGWVSAKLEGNAKLSFEQLREWVLESYSAVAPKALAARVGTPAATSAAPKAKTKAKAATAQAPKKAAAKAGSASPAKRASNQTAKTPKRAARAVKPSAKT
jgi:predicted DNA-binding protein (MmcQ/YjbR family)